MCDYSFWVFFPPCATLLETKIAHISEIFLSVRLLETENRTAMASLCKKKSTFLLVLIHFRFFFAVMRLALRTVGRVAVSKVGRTVGGPFDVQ